MKNHHKFIAHSTISGCGVMYEGAHPDLLDALFACAEKWNSNPDRVGVFLDWYRVKGGEKVGIPRSEIERTMAEFHAQRLHPHPLVRGLFARHRARVAP